MTTLYNIKVRSVLDRLYAANAIQEASPPILPQGFSLATSSPQERADALATVYMPISAKGGELLYSLVRASRPDTIVEFGTSFGISTIYLAAAVADNGQEATRFRRSATDTVRGNPPSVDPNSGFIGLQTHTGVVAFANVRIKT